MHRESTIMGKWGDVVWNEHMLGVMCNSIKVLFDYEKNKKRRKRSEQLSWEILYWKLRRPGLKLVPEDEEQT